MFVFIEIYFLAQGFGGGGHVKAAGCTIEGNIEDVISRILEAIQNRL